MNTTTFGGGAIIGNRFDTHTSVPVLASGTVSYPWLVWSFPGLAATTDSAGFVLLGAQTGGGGAMALFSTFTAGLTAATETVTFSGLGVNYTGASFFGAVRGFCQQLCSCIRYGYCQRPGSSRRGGIHRWHEDQYHQYFRFRWDLERAGFAPPVIFCRWS